MNKTYDALVLGGGESKGILMLGALAYLSETNNISIETIDIFSGTSIGASICLLLICGYTPLEIFQYICDEDELVSPEELDIWKVIEHMGLMTLDSFASKIKKWVSQKIGHIPTLLELRKITGKTLIVSVANITKLKGEYYSHQTEPHLNCVDAVIMSCNIPFIFQRLKYKDSYIIDGGATDNLPLSIVDDGVRNILALSTKDRGDKYNPESFLGYVTRVFLLQTNTGNDLIKRWKEDNVDLIELSYHKDFVVQIVPSQEDKINMFVKGYETAKVFLQETRLYIDNLHPRRNPHVIIEQFCDDSNT